ncbi:MAG: transcriptional regulator [Bacteroidia bacterium]
MKFDEAKSKFIQTWGKLASEWGINRTMAQVHALLLISHKPLSTEEVMEELSISRGNANMNLRELVNWTLIHKELVTGDRKEYFVAEKDIWEIAKRIAVERKKREIEPVVRVIDQLTEVEGDRKKAEIKEFVSMMEQLGTFVGKMDKSVDLIVRADENWLFNSIFKLVR